MKDKKIKKEAEGEKTSAKTIIKEEKPTPTKEEKIITKTDFCTQIDEQYPDLTLAGINKLKQSDYDKLYKELLESAKESGAKDAADYVDSFINIHIQKNENPEIIKDEKKEVQKPTEEVKPKEVEAKTAQEDKAAHSKRAAVPVPKLIPVTIDAHPKSEEEKLAPIAKVEKVKAPEKKVRQAGTVTKVEYKKRPISTLKNSADGEKLVRIRKFLLEEAKAWSKNKTTKKITKVMRVRGGKQEIILEVADYKGFFNGLSTLIGGKREYHQLDVNSFELTSTKHPKRGSYTVLKF